MSRNKIIILNGTSSSGKTSIVKEFQELAEGCYYRMRMDTIHSILPQKYLIYRNHREFCPDLKNELTEENRKGFYFEGDMKCKLGEYANNVSNDFIDLIHTLAKNNRNVIVYYVLYGTGQLKLIADVLKDFDVYIVRVFCEPQELEEREKQRGDRIMGSGEYGQKYIDTEYNDHVLDSTNRTPLDLAIELNDFIKSNGPQAMKKLYKNT